MCTSLRRVIELFVVVIGVAGVTMASSNQPSAVASKVKAYTTWSDYEGGADSAQYSALTQINKSNVSRLQQVWFYSAGTTNRRFGFNPIIVDQYDVCDREK